MNLKKKNILHKIPIKLREPILLIIIFFILSTPTARTTIGEYLPQIKPGSSGSVSYVGILLYGLVFVIIYMATKYLLELMS